MTWKRIEPGMYDSSYTGPMPARIYRYRSIDSSNFEDRLDQEVARREIYLCPFGRLNDPMEGILQVVVRGREEEIYERFERTHREQFPGLPAAAHHSFAETVLGYLRKSSGLAPPDITSNLKGALNILARVASFTTSASSRRMWRRYARWKGPSGVVPYGGICIGYDAGEPMRLVGLAPVKYIHGVPTLNVMSVTESSHDFRDTLFMKGNCWEYEREWRIAAHFKMEDIHHPDLDVNSKISMSEDGLDEVIVTNDTPPVVVDRIRRIAEQRDLPLRLKVAVPDGSEMSIADLD